jgi:hypothetical protein
MMQADEALRRADECRRAGARLYSKERGRVPMTRCLTTEIAVALNRAWYDGYLAATEAMKGLIDDDEDTTHPNA